MLNALDVCARSCTSAIINEVAIAIKDSIKNRRKSDALFVNGKLKLESLESNFDDTWRRSEIYQYFNHLDLSHANRVYETRAMTNAVKYKTVLSEVYTQDFGNENNSQSGSGSDDEDTDEETEDETEDDTEDDIYKKDFDDMDRTQLWTLRTVEKIIFDFGIQCNHEHLVHSWTIDVEDHQIQNLFNSLEWNEILKVHNKPWQESYNPEIHFDFEWVYFYILSLIKEYNADTFKRPHVRDMAAILLMVLCKRVPQAKKIEEIINETQYKDSNAVTLNIIDTITVTDAIISEIDVCGR
ncbi:3946_t:CDS:2 [Funneliformis geosporum]|nr:3946_t:CDS:2 [Funneliformis geosporum]